MDKSVPIRGKILSELRVAAFLSQAELAQRIGLSTGRLAAIEQADDAGMNLKNFRKLAEVLKADPAELLKRISEQAHNGDRPRVLVELPVHEHLLLTTHAREEGRSPEDLARSILLRGLQEMHAAAQPAVQNKRKVGVPLKRPPGPSGPGESASPTPRPKTVEAGPAAEPSGKPR
jgi:transcriptional regulator with XRE-family HTH domain